MDNHANSNLFITTISKERLDTHTHQVLHVLKIVRLIVLSVPTMSSSRIC